MGVRKMLSAFIQQGMRREREECRVQSAENLPYPKAFPLRGAEAPGK